MVTSAWYAFAAFLAAALAGGMAALLLSRLQIGFLHRSLAGLLAATTFANLANGIGLLDEVHALFWRNASMVAELLQPAALLYAGMTFLGQTPRQKDASALWRARIIGAIGLLLAYFVFIGEVFEWKSFSDGHAAIVLGRWGHAPFVFIVIGMALGLAQLELVLRASREPIRHRLKFIVIGLGGLAGYQIYQSSQMLLFSLWQPEHVLVSGVVTLSSLVLIGYGLSRSRLREVLVNTYISQQALFGSVTFIVIGLYLLVVGAIGEWFRRTNQPLGIGLSVVVVFGALVVLAIAAFSKTVRAEIRRFLSRNFYRSKYDYRAQWLRVTEAFQQAGNKDAIMDRLLDVLIKTFPTTSIAIWSFRESDRRFCQIRSMTSEREPAPLELSHPIIHELSQKDEPVFVEDGTDHFSTAGTKLCFPIYAHRKLAAFVALGQPLHGENYGTDDCDLLRGISHYVGALISHANLAEEREASAELEALHRFSVFCLHDLKNLAARLSLIAQNAESHGRDPAFQESAMRTVADTAKKMTALMTKLSLKTYRPGLTGTSELIEISRVVDEIVAPIIAGEGTVRVSVTGGPLAIMAVRDQIQQVLLNVIMNAKQALGQGGDISIVLGESNGRAIITVSDTGNGIPSNMLEVLFRPSQSNKPGGLGVGLYQCKQIIEAHRGTIQIRSEVGKGTQVRIELPSDVEAKILENKPLSGSAVIS